MNPKDLSKGNYVYSLINKDTPDEIKSIIQIDCLHRNTIETVDLNTWSYNQIAPISLDEKWLLDFNFEYVGLGNYELILPWRIFIVRKNAVGFTISEDRKHLTDIMYVNELQNVLYVLTKLELKLNEEEVRNK